MISYNRIQEYSRIEDNFSAVKSHAKCGISSIIKKGITAGADPRFCQGGWLAGQKNVSGCAAPRNIFWAVLGESGGMLPQEIFKIECGRLA